MSVANVSLTYKDWPQYEVDGNKLVGVYSPAKLNVVKEAGEMIAEALANPIGTPKLSELAKPNQKVVIVTDDTTRTTPADIIIPYLLDELYKAGIKQEDIKILIALGTHRPLNKQELIKKLGRSVVDSFNVINHEWQNKDAMEYLGTTSGGIEIWVNKEVINADLVIGIGHIVPHRIAGFSGGGKIIQPGVCGEITTGQTHWMSAFYTGKEILGRADNPVRKEIEAVSKKVGLDFIVNVVQDRKGLLVGVFAGDHIKAHRRGCEIAKEVYGVEIPELADIVIADSYPADVELWQATKAIHNAELALKKNGVIILNSPCTEGISVSLGKEIGKCGFKTLEEARQMLKNKEVTDLNVLSYLVRTGEVIKKRAKVILVSRGIDEKTAQKLGFYYARSPKEALNKAYRLAENITAITVLRQGGEILPLIKGVKD